MILIIRRGERRDAPCSPKGWFGVILRIAFTDLCNNLDNITYYLSSLGRKMLTLMLFLHISIVKTCCRGGGVNQQSFAYVIFLYDLSRCLIGSNKILSSTQ